MTRNRTRKSKHRIIPACAGKSPLFRYSRKVCQDHPRLRGEKHLSKCHLYHLTGSSPLARGKAFLMSEPICYFGIIPACAGKSRVKHFKLCCYGDHPRLRGEKFAPRELLKEGGGSSPLARGKVCTAGAFERGRRIIPACAGKSQR